MSSTDGRFQSSKYWPLRGCLCHSERSAKHEVEESSQHRQCVDPSTPPRLRSGLLRMTGKRIILREGQDPPLRGWTRAVGYLVGIATPVCALVRNDMGGTMVGVGAICDRPQSYRISFRANAVRPYVSFCSPLREGQDSPLREDTIALSPLLGRGWPSASEVGCGALLCPTSVKNQRFLTAPTTR